MNDLKNNIELDIIEKIREMLFELKDSKYAEFQLKLTPGVEAEEVIGVRVPALRKLAKDLKNNPDIDTFFADLPHRYYDETMLHGIILSELKDYQRCLDEVETLLPYVNNWAVCDIMSPKVFKKHKEELLDKIREWSAAEPVFTCRFGLEMLMSHYLDGDFKPEYLEIPAGVERDEYYVMMMRAWFFATALAKQWDHTISYIEEGRLDMVTHNKTIQKACESYRITPEQKTYLRSLKRK